LVLLLFNRGGSLCPLACPVKFTNVRSEAYLTGAVKKILIGLHSRFDLRHFSVVAIPTRKVYVRNKSGLSIILRGHPQRRIEIFRRSPMGTLINDRKLN